MGVIEEGVEVIRVLWRNRDKIKLWLSYHARGIMIFLLGVVLGVVAGILMPFYLPWPVPPVAPVPKVPSNFSTFEAGLPINDLGCQWWSFDDSTFYNGVSRTRLSIITRTRDQLKVHTDQQYCRLDYELGAQSQIAPFCGIISAFSPGMDPRNLSDYNYINIDVRHVSPIPGESHVYIDIGTKRFSNSVDFVYRYELTDRLQDRWVSIKIPFNQFKLKWGGEMTDTILQSDRKEIQKIAIVIIGAKGQATEGTLLLDNITFSK